MRPNRHPPLAAVVLISLIPTSAAQAKEAFEQTDNVTCYQNGQLVLKTQDRIREFVPTSAMKLVAELSLGQVRETHVKLYSSDREKLLCVITTQK
jgi:hypothetical protein